MTTIVNVKHCFVPGCENTSLTAKRLYFPVPKRTDLMAAWCNPVGYTDVRIGPLYCCSDHFKAEDLYWPQSKAKHTQLKVKAGTLPTVGGVDKNTVQSEHLAWDVFKEELDIQMEIKVEDFDGWQCEPPENIGSELSPVKLEETEGQQQRDNETTADFFEEPAVVKNELMQKELLLPDIKHELQCEWKIEVKGESALTNSTNGLLEDSLRHCGVQKYTCSRCEKMFSTRELLFKHEQTQTYPCALCGKRFCSGGFLIQHYKAQKYPCSRCEKKFCTLDLLFKHVQAHRYPCESCGKRFCSEGRLIQHYKAQKYPCLPWEKQFCTRELLFKHVQKHRYPFESCGKRFCSKGFLIQHCKAKKYPCARCEKKFCTKELLFKHEHMPMYPCASCGEQFCTKELLFRHEQMSRYPCASRGKRFCSKGFLIQHCEAQKYPCSRCEKSSVRESCS